MIRAHATAGTVVPEPYSAPERRGLRRCLVVAAAVHGGLLLLPLPWTEAEAAPAPPVRVVHRLVNVRPPAPPDPQPPAPQPDPPVRREPRPSVPVPSLVDETPAEPAPTLEVPEVDAPTKLPPILPVGPPPPVPPEDDEAPMYVVGAVEPPEAVFSPPPSYPRGAAVAHTGGVVVLQATIDREGRVTDLEVLRGAPLGMSEAALEAVRAWRFRPARLEGRPVAVYYHLTVRFETR